MTITIPFFLSKHSNKDKSRTLKDNSRGKDYTGKRKA